jgi:hypothetical protein
MTNLSSKYSNPHGFQQQFNSLASYLPISARAYAVFLKDENGVKLAQLFPRDSIIVQISEGSKSTNLVQEFPKKSVDLSSNLCTGATFPATSS